LNIDITTDNTWTEYVKVCNIPFSLSGVVLTCIQKNGDAAPFKKKGFFHYNHMAALMPNHVRGTHAFRASQQSFGAIANQPFATGSNMAEPRDTGIDLTGGDSSDNEQAMPLIPQSTPQRPPISTSTTSINSFASRQSKRKHSAFDDGDSTSFKSGSLTSSQDKRQRNTGVSALYSLGTKVDKMSDTFANGFAQESKARRRPDHSPQRRAKAAKSFQRLERGLTNEQKVAIMDLFETNTAAADMFLAVDEDDDGLRWAWLSNKLVQMGHLPLPARAEMSSV
jgi:hypothetical protein